MADGRITAELLFQHPGSPDSGRNRYIADGPDLRDAEVLLGEIETLRGQPRDAWPRPYALAEKLRSLGAEMEYPSWYVLARLVYREAVDVYRADGIKVTGDALGDYRHVLDRLGSVLVKLKRHEEALPIRQEQQAVSLRLAAVDVTALDLANDAQTEVVNTLVRLGQRDEAVDSAAEAIRQIRQQPDDKPGRPKSFTLAYALDKYVDCLTGVGRFDEAVDAAAEAVSIWRRHRDAGDESGWLGTDRLGQALGRLADALAEVRRYQEAYASIAEQVEIRRRAVDGDDDWFGLSVLGITLNNAGNGLGRLGRYREAVAVAEEAVRLDRAQAARAVDRKQRFLRLFPGEEELLHSGDQPVGRELFADGGLREVNDLFDDDELGEEFLESIDFDDEIREEHLSDFRAKVREADMGLCVTLYNLGGSLHNLNRVEEALAADSEAVEIARRHHDDGPKLAIALNNKACVLVELGRPEEAVVAAREAVALLTTLVVADPDEHEPTLALALHTLSLSAPDREEALSASMQCLDIYRRRYQLDPHGLAGRLAEALTDHGRIRARRGEHAEALAAAAESVAMYERLAAQNPARYRGGHACALLNLAEVHAAAGGAQLEASMAAERAVALYEALAADLPEAYEHRLAHARSVLRP
ncbi:tetratricopeptide repeat protein [Micromonospora sp. WMMD1102]|uniref:tetratricopeptide repeat protein n=1 Tax=Micromonospora sp. WMMD1102 TaxID=3016105 RepID=UPI0024155A0F|nr:tetratricopeptide repeat protein [Micromonospora sp. WMMD1102]MDG4786580.1 tetratricopeptide repeat protein [Micromonospora sp. WMMD1102]